MTAGPDGRQPASRPWLDPNVPAFVEMQGIRKTFGDFVAVDDVDLRMYRGELFCLLGGSGCGKTTLLRMLAGFETPTAGRILIDGQDMAGVPPYERPVNMMFQSYALFPHMNVEKNIAYGLKHEAMSPARRKDRVREMLELVQLADFGQRRPHQLSGGQRQRVALARALAKQPKLLLLDEPLAALDKKLREQTQFELMNIQDQVGVTFIVVTHDQEEAMALSTRIAVMDKGNIVQVGTPSEIYEFPSSRFTADFIGKINVFEGAVTGVNGSGATIGCAAAEGDLEVDSDGGLARGTPVWVAVRPEKIEISREAPAAGTANTLCGTVKDLAYFGDYSIYRVRLANDQIVHVSRQNVRRLSDEERQVDWDDEVWLTWRRDAALVLTE
jgi:putrescine transport system ATP-binding protein